MKAIRYLFRKKIKDKLQKGIAFKMALILLFNCAWPSTTFALTGGPSQPEVQSFEPVGVSDMVDLFSGGACDNQLIKFGRRRRKHFLHV